MCAFTFRIDFVRQRASEDWRNCIGMLINFLKKRIQERLALYSSFTGKSLMKLVGHVFMKGVSNSILLRAALTGRGLAVIHFALLAKCSRPTLACLSGNRERSAALFACA